MQLSLDKIVQGKIDDEHVWSARELNLHVRDLSPTSDPFAVVHSFLSNQLGISDITLDKCWFGMGDPLFIKFFSFADRLRALGAKRKLFSPL